MPSPQLLILAVLVLLGAGFGTWLWLEQRRGDRMRERAEALGLAYTAEDVELPAGLRALPMFGRGRGRKVRHHMAGAIADLELRIFDYQYSTGSGKNKSTHRFTVVALRCPGVTLPAFAVRPEHLGHRIAEMAGLGGVLPGGTDIDFEEEDGASAAPAGTDAVFAAGPAAEPRAERGPTFSRAFRLTGVNEAAIRACFGPEVRARFRGLERAHVEAAHDWIVVHHGARRARPEALAALVEEAFGLATAFGPA